MLRSGGWRPYRRLHIHLSKAKDLIKLEEVTVLIIIITYYLCFFEIQDASHISLGIGFIAAYTLNTSSSVWVQPFDCSSNLFGKLGAWHCLRLPEDAPVRKVACGRSHMVALTTEGKGIPTSAITCRKL